MIREYFVTIHTVTKVAILESKPISKTVADTIPIIALHGWLDNANSFGYIRSQLKDQHWYCIDAVGHGYSDHRGLGQEYHFWDNVIDIIKVIEELGLPKLHLMGHSMGAGVASFVASLIPEKVETLCLLDGFSPMVTPAHKAHERFKSSIAMREGDEVSFSRKPIASIEEAAKRRQMANSSLGVEQAMTLVKRSIKKSEGGVLEWSMDPRLKYPSLVRFTKEQVYSFLTEINCPTLLFLARDGFFDSKTIDEHLSFIKNREVVEVEGGHHFHMGDEFLDSIGRLRNFLG